jgi:hypothetical protein
MVLTALGWCSRPRDKGLQGRRLGQLVKFAVDSLLEGSGFEPSVPPQKDNAFEASPAPASRFVADRCKEGNSEASLRRDLATFAGRCFQDLNPQTCLN